MIVSKEMNIRFKTILSIIFLMVSAISMAQDNTRTKNNDADIYDNLYSNTLRQRNTGAIPPVFH